MFRKTIWTFERNKDMSSIVRADFFKEGYSATNQRNNEIVRLISKVNCTYEEI